MIRTGFQTLILTTLLLGVYQTGLADKVYKWTDENGVTHFSQHPPKQTPQSESVEVITPKANRRDSSAMDALRKKDAAFVARRKQGIEARQKQSEAAQKVAVSTEKCQQIRSTLTAIENKPRTLYKDDAGQTRRMDEDKRQEKMQEYRGFLSEKCR